MTTPNEKKPGNTPAFPVEWNHDRGVTIRDYFAAAALPVASDEVGGELAYNEPGNDPQWVTLVARAAYALADAMLAEREKKP